jgi:hypothetical protein
MRAKNTSLWVLAAIAVLAFILLWERRIPSTDDQSVQPHRLFPGFMPGNVSRIEIMPQAANLLRLEHTNGHWFLTHPLFFPGHESRVAQFLETIRNLASLTDITAQDLLARTNNLSEYGLDPPAAVVVLRHGQDRLELRIGKTTLTERQTYLQIVGADTVHIVPSVIRDRLPLGADEWRNPSLLGMPGAAFDRLEARMAAPFGFALQWEPDSRRWRLQQPMVARADNPKIDQLIRQLGEAKVSRFLADAPSANLESLGLQPPQLELALGRGSNLLANLRFGHSPTNAPQQVYALNLQYSNLFLADKDLVEKFKVPYTELRDRHLFSEPLTGIALMEIRADESFVVQRQTNQQWWITQPTPMPADEARIREFLDQLGYLPLKEFTKDVVTDFASFGLAPPARHYVLKRLATPTPAGATHTIAAEIGFGIDQPDRVLVRRMDENSVYAVGLEDFQRLPQAAHQLRDRRIWDFAPTNLASLSIHLGTNLLAVARTSTGQWLLGASNTPLADPLPLMLDELAVRFGSFQADAWIARGEDKLEPYGFLKPDPHKVELRLTTATNLLILDLGDVSPHQCYYAAVVLDGQRLVFELGVKLHSLYLEIARQLAIQAAPPALSP